MLSVINQVDFLLIPKVGMVELGIWKTIVL